MADVVGTIQPSKDGGPPLFTIVRDHGIDPPANVRPCDHRQFILDEKWSTVTCGKCGERLDAFAALMRYAEWWLEFERRQEMARHAEKRLHIENLRRLRRLRDIEPGEVEEIDAALGRHWSAEAEELRSLARRIERAIRERKATRREAKRRKERPYIGPKTRVYGGEGG